jgi:hypothetical protein
MILTLKYSGGLGVSYQGSVDVDTLPAALRAGVDAVLSDEHLSSLARRPRDGAAVDTVTYEIGLGAGGGTYRFDESQADAAVLDLIDELRPHLVLGGRE